MMLIDKYSWFLFDLDETLVNFPQQEALQQMTGQVGITLTHELQQHYQQHNKRLWQAYAECTIDAASLQRQRFEPLAAHCSHSPEQLNQLFLDCVVENTALYNGASELLRRLSQHAEVAIVTNGFDAVQRQRISRVLPDFCHSRVFTSEQIGSAKPQPEAFSYVFAQLGIDEAAPHEALMIGDNLATDIAGAHRAGLDACYLGDEHPGDAHPGVSYHVTSIDQLSALIFG